MKNLILQGLSSHKINLKGKNILVGLSGGPDSVCLLSILNELKTELNFKIAAAHLNHEARAEASADEQFCRNICKKLGIEFYSEKISNLKLLKSSGSKEELWRNARRQYFEDVAKEIGADFIALGHHAQDQVETFFIRLIRGTTLDGLTCMKFVDCIYLRPLLEINKTDILKNLEKNKLPFVIDQSNESEKFLRNRIRKFLPALEKLDDRFFKNFQRTLSNLTEAENFIKKETEMALEKVAPNQILEIQEFFKLDKLIQGKVLLLWLKKSKVKFQLTEKFIAELQRFLKQPQGKSHQISNWKIVKKKRRAEIKLSKV